MRRLLRLAFNLLGTLSAALFLTTAVLWARRPPTREVLLSWPAAWEVSCDGNWLVFDNAPAVRFAGQQVENLRPIVPRWDDYAGRHVFGKISDDPVSLQGLSPSIPQHVFFGYELRRIVFPLGLVAVGCFLLSKLTQLVRLPARAGVCPGCGYDLRATPEEGGALLGRCPECGAVPAQAA